MMERAKVVSMKAFREARDAAEVASLRAEQDAMRERRAFEIRWQNLRDGK